jgi:hypothetical protein
MAKINDGTLKDWKDGDKVTSDLYEADREILRVANNDNHDRIVTLEVDKPIQDKRLDDLEYNVTGTVVPMTFKELGMQNLTFDDIKLGYVDQAIAKAWKPSLDTLTRGIVEETTAIDGQTVVSLTNSYTVGGNQITVEIDGVPQDDTSYTETSTTSITLSEALVAGQRVVVTIGKVDPNADARFSSLTTQLAEIANLETFNLTNGLRKWRSAKARLDAGLQEIVDINFLGDSISEGAFASFTVSDWINLGYVGKIRNFYTAKYGNVGTGIIPISYPNGSPFIINNGFTVDSSGYGFAQMVGYTNRDGDKLTYNFNGTGVRIFLVKGLNASFTTTIDGGAPVQRTSGGTWNWADTIDITGLSDGNHTLVITKNGGDNNTLYIAGCMPFKGNSGLRVNFTGKYGTTAQYCSFDQALLYEFINQPTLTILSLNANDYGGQTPINTYISQMSKIVDKAKESGDVLITSVGVHNDAKTIPQIQYVDAIKNIAKEKNCAFLDIYSRWGGLEGVNSTGFINAGDNTHPNLQGHQDIANAIMNVLNT